MKDAEFLKQHNVDLEKSLELFGDMETYNETIKEFQTGIPKKLSEIEKYYNAKDMENYAIYVHSLKSDCKYFGFMELADLAYEHELAAKANDFAKVEEKYEALMSKALEVKDIVNEYLGETEETNKEDEKLIDRDIIVVADDSEVIRIFVKKIFDKDFDIQFATNGEEALEIIKDHENDDLIKAILLDINMPKVDGFAVLEYLREKDLFREMPVTIISGDSSSDAINKAFTFDIVDMITKPFSEEKIKSAVEKTITRNK